MKLMKHKTLGTTDDKLPGTDRLGNIEWIMPDMLENMNKIEILLCDDPAFVRVTLRRIIESAPGIQVVDIARNREEAIEKAIRLRPDVIVLDLHIPVVDGLTALRDMVRLKIAPVIMLSAATTEDAPATMAAMAAGAFDFIAIPDEMQSMDFQAAAIIQKIRQAAAPDIYGKLHKNQQPIKENDFVSFLSSSPPKCAGPGGKGFKAAALGLSTGGPHTIFKVLPHLPPDLNAASIVVQHMPSAFITTFTRRLNRETVMECSESKPGMRVEPKKIYIAGNGYHNALAIKYISGSRAHDNIYMAYGNGYLKGFKAAQSQTSNLPSPPFPFLWAPRPGSSHSLTPLKAQKPPGLKGTPHSKQVSPPSCLCVPVAPFRDTKKKKVITPSQ